MCKALDSSGEIILNIPKFPVQEVQEVKPGKVEARRSAPGGSSELPIQEVKPGKLEEAVSSAPGCSYQTYCDLDVKLSDDEDYFGDDNDILLQEALLASTNPTRSTNDLHPNEGNDHDR